MVEELKALTAVNDRSSTGMLLDIDGGPAALKAACHDVATSRVAVCRIGDGEALSGLLVVAVRPESNRAGRVK